MEIVKYLITLSRVGIHALTTPRTPLLNAIENGYSEIAMLLFQHRKTCPMQRLQALIFAAKNNKANLIAHLLSNPQVRQSLSQNTLTQAFNAALDASYTAVAATILSYMDPWPENTGELFFKAVVLKDSETVKMIGESGQANFLNHPNKIMKGSALHVPAYTGDIEMIEILLKFPELDLTLKDIHSKTAENLATSRGHKAIAKRIRNEIAKRAINNKAAKKPDISRGHKAIADRIEKTAERDEKEPGKAEKQRVKSARKKKAAYEKEVFGKPVTGTRVSELGTPLLSTNESEDGEESD